MAKWYIGELEKFYADKPERLDDIITENALKLIPGLIVPRS